MPKKTLLGKVRTFNLIAHLCHAALGPDHHPAVRYSAGAGIMCIGVAIAKFGGQIHVFHIHFFADLVGYGVHGLGLVPFIEKVIEWMDGTELHWPELEDE